MDKAQLQKALKYAKENSTKRNFKQSVDLIINLKDIDLKKQDNRVDVFSLLHFERGKKLKICGLVGPELKAQSEKAFDTTVVVDDFSKYKGKELKVLAKSHDFFVAQANIMPQVASAFGRVLGPRGKMPNPKAGCVVPPNANLDALSEKLQKTLRIKVETSPLFQATIGKEDTDDAQLVDNAMTIYNSLVHALPNDKHNVKDIYVKLTMGKAFKLGEEPKKEAEKEKEAPAEKKAEKKVEPKEEAPAKKEEPQAEPKKEPKKE
jgi:large subunit ribosomal protein L1